MSVYIKGMEMPENCAVCPIRSWNGEDDICPFSEVEALPIGRQVKCPLVEIPPHGRMIDADELVECVRKIDGEFSTKAFLSWVTCMKTVLPADKED